ncbi:MAG TPA: ABC transporter permease [Vicinamibacterales bacterium]|nr:ABC transporter permease [Vicinamibacterales bacterium]
MTAGDPRRRIERDIDDEIRFHLESRVRDLVAKGEPDAEARRRAEAEFGDLSASRRELAAVDQRRSERGLVARWIGAVGQDVRYAARSLRRSPAYTIAATAVLSVGIGATVTIFAIVEGVLLRPLPFGHPDRLVGAWHDMPSIGLMHQPQAPATYFTYKLLAHSIDGIGVYREADVNVAQPGGASEPERLANARISATLLPVLEVAPLLGRPFTEADDRPGAAPVALISEGLWRSRFAGDVAVIGRPLEVDGVRREVIGVMPASFRFPSAATALWIPLQLDPVEPPASAFAYGAVARLKPGVAVADATREFAAVLPHAPEVVPKFVPGITTRQILDQVHPAPTLVPLREDLTGAIAGTLWILAFAATLVLLVACANVANLTLVRADTRQREVALRAALGAGRVRLLLHFFVESCLVAGISAALGLAAATLGVRLFVRTDPANIPRLAEVSVDWGVTLFAIAIAALVAIACGLVPALRFRRPAAAIRDGGRSQTAARAQHRLRGALVAIQIAVALIAMAGSGLLLRTVAHLHAVRPGFDAARVSTFWISLPAATYKGDGPIVTFYSGLVERVRGLPNVEAAGLASRLPLESHGLDPNPLYPEDDPSYGNKLPPLQLLTSVDEHYFHAMGIPLLAGKPFERMNAQRDGEAIVSSSTARLFWNDATGAAALGKRFRLLPTRRLYTIIGVTADVRDTALTDASSPVVYFPETIEADATVPQTKRTMALVVRTANEQDGVADAVRKVVRDLDPSLPVFDARPMSVVVGAATAQLTFVIGLLGAAAAMTLALGAVGLYGMLGYVVTLRRRELGIRLALGASPRAVTVAFTRDGVGLAALGIVVGLGVFGIVARYLRTWLFGVAASDPVTIGASVAALLAIATLASWAPARRAARVNPVEALRAE